MIGHNTNAELRHQDQKLDRINTKLDATNQELKQSNKLVSSIGSWWGMFKNKIKGWKYSPTELPTEAPEVTKPQPSAFSRPNYAYGQETAVQGEKDPDDEMLDTIINNANQLKYIAKNMNQSLTHQKTKIDVINKKVDMNLNNIDKLNKTCKKMLD